MADDPQKPAQPGFTSVEDIMSSFNDLFGTFFGQQALDAGPDVRIAVPISEAEAATGSKREIAYRYARPCVACGARGSLDPDAVRISCTGCGGVGHKQVAQGFFTMQTVCSDCRGAKVRIANPCGACEGRGRMLVDCKLVVEVPAGVGTQVIRMPAQGNADLEGKRGDLLVHISVGACMPARMDHLFGPQPQIPQAIARDPRSARAAADERKRWILTVAAMFATAVLFYLILNR